MTSAADPAPCNSLAAEPPFGRAPYGLCLALGVVGLCLRLWQAGDTSFWLDEVFQVRAAMEGPAAVWTTTPHDKSPLDYLVASLVLMVADGEVAGRLPAIVYGGIWVAAMGWVAWLVSGCRGAVVATGLLAAFSPMARRYGQEASPYSLMMLSQTLLLAMLLVHLRGRQVQRSAWALGAAVALALWAGFIQWPGVAVLAVGGLVAWWAVRGREGWRPLDARGLAVYAGAFAGAGLVALPLYLRMRASAVDGYYAGWDVVDPAGVAWLYLTIFGMGYDWYAYAAWGAWWVVPPAALGLVVVARRHRAGAVLLVAALVQFPLAFALMRWQDHWMECRYTIGAYPAFLVLAGLGAGWLGGALARVVRCPARGDLVAGVLMVPYVAAALSFAVTQQIPRNDWRGALEFVAQHRTADQRILAGTMLEGLPVLHYAEVAGLDAPVTLPAGTPEDLAQPAWLVTAASTPPVEGFAVVARFPWTEVRVNFGDATAGELRHARAAATPLGPGDVMAIDQPDHPAVGSGWLPVERWGDQWAMPVQAGGGRLAVPIRAGSGLRVEVRLHVNAEVIRRGGVVTLRANGTEFAPQPSPDGQGWMVWDIPPGALVPGVNVLEMVPSVTIVPRELDATSLDIRALSFWLMEARITGTSTANSEVENPQ